MIIIDHLENDKDHESTLFATASAASPAAVMMAPSEIAIDDL